MGNEKNITTLDLTPMQKEKKRNFAKNKGVIYLEHGESDKNIIKQIREAMQYADNKKGSGSFKVVVNQSDYYASQPDYTEEGHKAYKDGLTIIQNPYFLNSIPYKGWQLGWLREEYIQKGHSS